MASSTTPVKQIINKPEDAVREMLDGFLMVNPLLARLDGYDVSAGASCG